MQPFVLLFLKFALVTQVGTVVYISVAHWMTKTLKVNRYVSTGVGFLLGIVPNYILNRIWTFRSTDPNIPVQYSKYLVIGVSGLFLNQGLLVLFLEVFKMKFMVAKLVAILFVTVFSFLLNHWLTFTDV